MQDCGQPARAEHRDPAAPLGYYPKPKQLIVQHNLAGQLRSLLERERDGELLLVQQMARGLLNALLVNSVL